MKCTDSLTRGNVQNGKVDDGESGPELSNNVETLKNQRNDDIDSELLPDVHEDGDYQPIHSDPFLLKPTDASLRRQSVSERRR